MYAVTKNSYRKTVSNWTDNREKRKVRHDDSDFDDSKSESFFEPHEISKNKDDELKSLKNHFTELQNNQNANLTDIKNTQNVFLNELMVLKLSTDNTLEYIKSIDSDTKNTIEKIDKYFTQENTPDIVKHINTLYNKNKLTQDHIQCELNTLASHYDYVMSKLEFIFNLNTALVSKINKVSFDHQHILNELMNMNKKLDYMTSQYNYLSKKTIIKNDDIINDIINDDIINDIKNDDIVNDIINDIKIDIKNDDIINDNKKDDINNHVLPIDDNKETSNLPLINQEEKEQQTIFKTSPKPNRSSTKIKKK
jgi:hypothetical protein